jgi:hypothetical protein
VDSRNLDDACGENQGEVDPVVRVVKESTPIRQRGKDSPDNFDIEGYCESKLTIVQYLCMYSSNVDSAGGLQDQGRKDQDNPKPVCVFINALEVIGLCNLTTIDSSPLFIVLISGGLQSAQISAIIIDKNSLCARSRTKSTLLRVQPDRRKRIGDDRNEQVYKPEI